MRKISFSNLLQSTVKVEPKTCFWVVVLSVVIAGIRGSDAGVLLAIASGRDMSAAIFGNLLSQNIWDCPLKVALLRLLPPNIIWIYLVFLIIAALPLTGLFIIKNRLFIYLTGILILITPAIKISFQNIGVGDGLLSLLTVIAVSNNSNLGIALPFFLLGLWHPQQAFFIGSTYIIFSHIFKSDDLKKRLINAALGLFIALVVFYLYKTTLGFSYADRLAYMLSDGRNLFVINLKFLPLGVFYPIFWLFIIKRMFPDVRLPFYAIIWIIILTSITLFTSDVTRVLSNILLPMILISMRKKYFEEEPKSTLRLPLLWVVIAVIMPIISWSGIDIFLYSDFARDLCKYFSLCF